MNDYISEITIPDGKEIFCINQEEVEYLYPQMPNYIKHGIKLDRGNTIFDVGANIGMFSLMCSSYGDRQIDIYAFEPIPQIFEVLRLNIQRFNLDRVKLYNYGLSNKLEVANFEYYPKASGFSTMFPESAKSFRQSVSSIMLSNIAELPSSVSQELGKLPQFLRPLVLNLKLRQALKSQTVKSKLKTVSQVIQEQNIAKIDLLKIDVERSELNVLLGIQPQDWQKIKQVAIEAHDIENRIDRISALLSEQNFDRIVVEQEPLLEKSEYFNIYATRSYSRTKLD